MRRLQSGKDLAEQSDLTGDKVLNRRTTYQSNFVYYNTTFMFTRSTVINIVFF